MSTEIKDYSSQKALPSCWGRRWKSKRLASHIATGSERTHSDPRLVKQKEGHHLSNFGSSRFFQLNGGMNNLWNVMLPINSLRLSHWRHVVLNVKLTPFNGILKRKKRLWKWPGRLIKQRRVLKLSWMSRKGYTPPAVTPPVTDTLWWVTWPNHGRGVHMCCVVSVLVCVEAAGHKLTATVTTSQLMLRDAGRRLASAAAGVTTEKAGVLP